MKRILTALMALLVVMSFAVTFIACDTGIDTGDDNKPPVTDKDGNTVISIMVHVDRQSAEGKAYQKRVDAFNVAHRQYSYQQKIIYLSDGSARATARAEAKDSYGKTAYRSIAAVPYYGASRLDQ